MVIVNVRMLVPLPAAELGTDATAVLLLVKVIVPLVGTAPEKTTVPVAAVPPLTLAGVSVRDEMVAALTVSVAILFTAP